MRLLYSSLKCILAGFNCIFSYIPEMEKLWWKVIIKIYICVCQYFSSVMINPLKFYNIWQFSHALTKFYFLILIKLKTTVLSIFFWCLWNNLYQHLYIFVLLSTQDNITEKTSCGTSTNSALNEIYSTKEQSSSVVEKQEKVDSKNEIAVSPLKEVVIF